MKARFLHILFAATLLLAACGKIPQDVPPVDDSTYDYGLTVRNEDYEASIVLDGLAETALVSTDNLPAWIPGITLREEGQDGHPVALVSVKGDRSLEESRSASVVLNMQSGAKVNLELTQWPVLSDNTNAEFKSVNSDFEKDWSSAQTIKLVISSNYENGRLNVVTRDVGLPWAHDKLAKDFLPKGEIDKMIERKNEWALVFNLTGINNRPQYNYFGLYNRYLGKLRIFYYFTQEMIPSNNTNDHLWAVSLANSLSEHMATQFALPYKEKATPAFKAMAAHDYLTTPVTDGYNILATGDRTVPSIGWWAFDVNMSAMRDHNFFDETPSNALKLTLCTFDKTDVLLSSEIKGALAGNLLGSLKLDGLVPTSAGESGKWAGPIATGLSTFFTNNFFLKEVLGTGWGPASLVVGCIISFGGKLWEALDRNEYEKDPDNPDGLGDLNATISLDLNAVMTTEGSLSGPTTNKVPSASMTIDYLNPGTKDNPTGLGQGVWNIDNHPVVYVVNDAYWRENNFNVVGSKVEYKLNGQDVYSYDLGATKGSRPGLRLISFLDPTSIGGVEFNTGLYRNGLSSIDLYLSYGVYPGSVPGYTDAFRNAAGLDYQQTWRLSTASSFSSTSLKLFRAPHTDDIFKGVEIDQDIMEVAAYRLSNQMLKEKVERRYYGSSLYYTKAYATPNEVDQVQFVYDPAIYVPYDDEGHKLYDPQVPDFVVTAAIRVVGRDPGDRDAAIQLSTLRFVPEIRYISYKDLQKIYNEMKIRKNNLKGPGGMSVNFPVMEQQLQQIEKIINAAK